MSQLPYVVIGAGVGGLATALRLAHRGESVVLLEKTDRVGGRNKPVRVGDCVFDGGPTLMMMLDPFRKLYADVGERIEDHLDLHLCDPSYRVFFADGTGIDSTTNLAQMVPRIAELAGREESLRYPKMLGDLAALYHASVPNFVEKNFYNPLDFFGGKALAHVTRHRMLGNLASGIARYVEDPRLRMLFSFQTMYLGLSPYEAPWVYAVLTYMEYGEGIWYPRGGMVRIAESIAELAAAKGADIRLNSPVARVEGKTVLLESGERIEAKAVICNADLPYAERELLRENQPKKAKRRYSCSAFMMYLDYQGSLPKLLHHNVFFGPDFAGNLDQIFHQLTLPEEPAFYAAITSRTDAVKAPEGHENLYLLVPCPNLGRPWTEHDGEILQKRVFDRLARETGFDPAKVVEMKTYSPADWRGDLNLDRGAAFGLSHDFWQSAYFRPGNRSKTNPNVYFVGASTVPGNGLPMVLISADLAVQRLAHDGFLR